MAVRTSYALLAVPALVTLVIAGCGGNGTVGSTPDEIANEVVQTFKIQEYVGDGHGGTKPHPTALFPLLAPQDDAVVTQGHPTSLPLGANYHYDNVYPGAVNWFYVPHVTADADVVVTLQPVHNRDADLYILQGSGPYQPDVHCHAYSDRAPTDGDNVRGVGYAPDWAYYMQIGSTNGYPVANVAVYGGPKTSSLARYFRIEADAAQWLKTNGAAATGSLGEGQSAWYYFNGTMGSPYRVGIQALSGDPDVYVYGPTSTTFAASHIAVGGGYANLTAAVTDLHFVRVYGYSSCSYRVKVKSP